MSDLHIISENDELSMRNGSAILSVAKELQKAAVGAGTNSWIGGGEGKSVNLPDTIELIHSRRIPRLIRPVITRLSSATKFAFGVSLTSGRIPRPIVSDVSSVFCHNQPWLQSQARKAYPSAKVHLYVHNQILRGAPASKIRRVLNGFDSVISVSDYISNDLQARAKYSVSDLNKPSFHTVYNGVDSTRFTVEPTFEPVDVVYVGRLVPDKGAHILAAAMAEMAKVRNCSLRIVGGANFLPGEELTPYEKEVFAALAVPRLDFHRTGPVPPANVPALINSSRLMVIPSVWDDPCPLTFLEGLASRAAVVASRVGGMPEVGHESGAIFVEPNDPTALAEELNRLLDDPELGSKVAREGHDWAANRSWSAVYDELCVAIC